MRVLGVDLGLKRTGLALSDEKGISIKLLPNLLAHSRAKAIEKIIHLIKDFQVKAVVIGFPKPNTLGSKAIYTRAMGLSESLKISCAQENLNVAIFLWDEAMTSKQASRKLIEANIPLKKRSLMIDAAAAAVIVEEFLREHNNNYDI